MCRTDPLHPPGCTQLRPTHATCRSCGVRSCRRLGWFTCLSSYLRCVARVCVSDSDCTGGMSCTNVASAISIWGYLTTIGAVRVSAALILSYSWGGIGPYF
jgi:hypothetical protein